MDMANFRNKAPHADKLWALWKPTVGRVAFDFALQYGDELFPGVPIVGVALQSADFKSRAPHPNVISVGAVT